MLHPCLTPDLTLNHSVVPDPSTTAHSLSSYIDLVIINAGKTKVMWLNANNSQAITISVKDVDDVEDFIYLGTTISKTGGTNVDIRRRIDHSTWPIHCQRRFLFKELVLATPADFLTSSLDIFIGQ
jgi:hypothetical protein